MSLRSSCKRSVVRSHPYLRYVCNPQYINNTTWLVVLIYSFQTAQVASQQGKYLGKKLSKLARQREILAANDIPFTDEAVASPFRYLHLGSLAYIGNAAVFDLGSRSFMGGLAAMYAWRSVYWSEQVSSRTRALLMFDWIIRWVAIAVLNLFRVLKHVLI